MATECNEMTDAENERRIATVELCALESLGNAELAAANNAINFVGKVPPKNLAYAELLDRHLIGRDGYPHDVERMKRVLAVAIKQRMDAGTFV